MSLLLITEEKCCQPRHFEYGERSIVKLCEHDARKNNAGSQHFSIVPRLKITLVLLTCIVLLGGCRPSAPLPISSSMQKMTLVSISISGLPIGIENQNDQQSEMVQTLRDTTDQLELKLEHTFNTVNWVDATDYYLTDAYIASSQTPPEGVFIPWPYRYVTFKTNPVFSRLEQTTGAQGFVRFDFKFKTNSDKTQLNELVGTAQIADKTGRIVWENTVSVQRSTPLTNSAVKDSLLSYFDRLFSQWPKGGFEWQ